MKDYTIWTIFRPHFEFGYIGGFADYSTLSRSPARPKKSRQEALEVVKEKATITLDSFSILGKYSVS